MKNKNNLPAKREINLFTSSKNIDNNKISEIVETIKQAKKVKLLNAEKFDCMIYRQFDNLNIDTIMYLVEHYGFNKPRIESRSWNNSIIVRTNLDVKLVSIDLYSESWQLNLLPNDVKELITQ